MSCAGCVAVFHFMRYFDNRVITRGKCVKLLNDLNDEIL